MLFALNNLNRYIVYGSCPIVENERPVATGSGCWKHQCVFQHVRRLFWQAFCCFTFLGMKIISIIARERTVSLRGEKNLRVANSLNNEQQEGKGIGIVGFNFRLSPIEARIVKPRGELKQGRVV